MHVLYHFIVGGNCGPAPQVDRSSNIHSGQQVTYSCVRGYDLIGSSVINCLPSGVWSPDPPMCNGTNIRVVGHNKIVSITRN